MADRRDRGMALVLVMTVVLALAIVATPFVLSMLLQERAGTAARYASQAHYGADGARNYAIWRLMLSLDPVERRQGTGLFSSYTYDTDQEFDIRLDDPALTGKIKVADPQGTIWGLSVQDEQGKLNVRSAPVRSLTTVSQLVDGRVVDLKDYLTQYSGRDATWIYPQRLRPVGFQNGQASGGITVDNLHVLGPGSRVRATKSGMKPLEAVVTGNSLLGGGGQDGFTTSPSVSSYLDGVIEVEGRHPVNLNTARRETLVAMFEGLRLHNVPTSVVGRDAAVQLATRFGGRDLQRLDQFILALASSPLNGPQKLAVALNAVCPNATRLEGSGTVPIAFKSHDVYTLESFGAVSNPAGVSVAGRGYREVVSVSPPVPLTLYCESQHDFHQMYGVMAAALAGIDPKLAFSGYPFGSRLQLTPNVLPTPPDTTLKPAQNKGPNGNEATVAIIPAKDFRGESPLQQFLTGWPTSEARDHFDGDLDGKRLSNAAQVYPWGQIFTLNHDLNSPPPIGAQRPDVAAGGFEGWVRFDTVTSPLPIFDIREGDKLNRLTLRVENGELILTACDGTLPHAQLNIGNGTAEIRQPFVPLDKTWYHFGVYWRGTRYAGLALLVDGFAHPQQKFAHTGTNDAKVITKLGGALTPTSTTLTLQDGSFLPNEPTPVLVGDEVILYDPQAGTVVRGARGTNAVDHPSQATVSVFGYSSKIRNATVVADYPGSNPAFQVSMPYSQITTGGATLLYNFGLDPQADVAGDKQDTTTMQWQIDATQTDIGVITPAINDFPDQGYIRIQTEVIFYTGRSTGGLGGAPPGNAKFTGCQRGQHGTVPAIHRSGANVRMWSIAVNTQNGYDSPTVLAIGDEWFGPVRKDPLRPTFWIGFVDVDRPYNFRRGNACFATIPSAHSAADRVLPTFVARDIDPWPTGRESLGRWDRVTVMDETNTRETARVRWTSPPPPPNGQPPIWPGNFNIQGGGQLASFELNVSKPYVADDLHVRIQKFPSGELLSRAWLDRTSPSVTIGPLDGAIDETKAFAMARAGDYLAMPATATDLTMQFTQINGIWPRGGLVKIGDEYVGYGASAPPPAPGQPATLSRLKRGWLGPVAEIHDRGDPVFVLPWIPVTSLAGDLSATDAVVNLNERLPGRPNQYTEGYLLVDEEILKFKWSANDGKTLSMPPRWDGQSGLYRGMFGTQPSSHSATTSLAYGIPFRAWDTYKAREFDNTMTYFQWSTKMDLAHWQSFWWSQEIPKDDPLVVVHAFARIDGKGEFWDAPGMTDKALLIESITPNQSVKVNRTGYRNEAGQFDVRFYVEYKPGAFDPLAPHQAHAWKRSPKIKEIRVEYDRPTQTLFHEDH